MQSLDIFIEDLKIGLEYQGAQHLRPVEYFEGEEAFKKTQERDKRKKQLCYENDINPIYVYENYNLEDVIKEIEAIGNCQADADDNTDLALNLSDNINIEDLKQKIEILKPTRISKKSVRFVLIYIENCVKQDCTKSD